MRARPGSTYEASAVLVLLVAGRKRPGQEGYSIVGCVERGQDPVGHSLTARGLCLSSVIVSTPAFSLESLNLDS